MKKSPDYKQFVGFALILILFLMAVIMYGTYQLRNLKSQVAHLQSTQLTRESLSSLMPEQKLTVVEGAQGLVGPQGLQGATGQSGVSTMGEQGMQGAKGEKGDSGNDGKDGANGLTPVLQVDEHCRLLIAYPGDAVPALLTQLPEGCQ